MYSQKLQKPQKFSPANLSCLQYLIQTGSSALRFNGDKHALFLPKARRAFLFVAALQADGLILKS